MKETDSLTATGIASALDNMPLMSICHAENMLSELFELTSSKHDLALILGSPMCPPRLLSVAAKTFGGPKNRAAAESIEILASISLNPNTSPEILNTLAKHPNPLIRVASARNPNIGTDTLTHLSKDKDWEVRQQVGSHAHTSADDLVTLATDKDSSVHSSVLRNPNLPIDALLNLLGENPDVPHVRAAAWHPDLPEQTTLTWARHHAPTIRAVIAGHKNLPPFALTPLLAEGDLRIEAGLATNPNLPTDVAVRLADPSKHINTRLALAGNSNLPLLAAILLLVDPDPLVRRRTALIQKCLTRTTLTQAAIEEDDPRVLTALITHHNMPSETSQRHLDHAVVWATGNATTLARTLAYSTHHPITPAAAYTIAAIGDIKALAALATRADCPHVILIACARNENPALRRAAAINPAIPEPLLTRLTNDPDPTTRLVARSRPITQN